MLSRLRDSLYIIYQKCLIVKRFSESFLKKFSSKNAYKLLIEGLTAASAAGQLAYYSNVYDYCQGLFLIFSTKKNSIVKCNNFLLIFLYILSHHNKAVNIHSFVSSLL